ncbi:hypothetical protein J7J00_04110 [Bacillus sp. ISL-4]|uniref:hypothetical protein n=1 Tax=Bacillus sp. ISL-4 TaxID=2819125 RepID=UPI001BED2FC9|nr:hypothetical protein [Bacillus sp. ISL-4]MBT2664669.1 hypothetical protein [Bacillus sp. ISL-4]
MVTETSNSTSDFVNKCVFSLLFLMCQYYSTNSFFLQKGKAAEEIFFFDYHGG